MDFSSLFDPQAAAKAIAGGIVGAIIALVSHYGFQPTPEAVTALGVVVTAVVGYVVGHIAVYSAPANKK